MYSHRFWVGWIRIQEGKNDPQKVKSKEFIFRMFFFRGPEASLAVWTFFILHKSQCFGSASASILIRIEQITSIGSPGNGSRSRLSTIAKKIIFLPVLRIRIRDPVPFWPLDPGSGMGFFPDPGSRDHILKSFLTIFWVKSSIILWKLAQILFFSTSKLK